MPSPVNEYVAWVDVMGTKSSMSRSIAETANFIFKLHIAAISAAAVNVANVRLYPVMDGVYATAADQPAMLSFLRGLFHAIAVEFNQTDEPFSLNRSWTSPQPTPDRYREFAALRWRKNRNRYAQLTRI